MAVPTFDANKHDINIGGFGFMRAGDGPISVGDAAPATARAAEGEGRYDTFQTESFVAQADWEGGAGQARFRAGDAFLSGVGISQFEGAFFPPWKKIDESGNGGVTSWYFNRGSTLYGLDTGGTNEGIDQIGTNTDFQRPAGTVRCKPAVSGNGSAFWVQDVSGTNQLMRWTGSGAATDVSPDTTTPYLVGRYGKWMWCFGKRKRSATPHIVQDVQKSFTDTDTVTITYDQATIPFNLRLLVIWVRRDNGELARPQSALTASGFGGGSGVGVPHTLGSWSLLEYFENAATCGSIYVYYQNDENVRSGNERITFDDTVSDGVVSLIEIGGIQNSPFIDMVQGGTDSTNHSTSPWSQATDSVETGTLLQAKELVMVVLTVSRATATITSLTAEAGWTQLFQVEPIDDQVYHGIFYKVTSATTSEAHNPTITVTGGAALTSSMNLTAAFLGTPLTVDTDQFTLHYTEDDGATWNEVAPVSGTGIGTPLACLATQGYLWFTTDSGLYSLSAAEREFSDQTSEVIVAIAGPKHEWQYPKSTGTAGTRLTTDGESLFYNVGASLWRYPIGGASAAQIWPTESWAIKGGDIQDVVAGEGGIYFGAGGFLWVYNKRGFHCLAVEPASNAYDTLHWHNGRLYFRASPADYYNVGYPSSRPDMYSTAGANFDTGYVITSEMDFSKVNVVKAIRTFEVHASFTGGVNATQSGTIALHYYLGCSGAVDPGQVAGGATGLSWTSIGSMSVVDGGVETFTLATPLYCYRLYVRATITPGTVGYPILRGIVINGRAMMPMSTRISAPLKIGTQVVDAQNTRMYPTQAAVEEAVTQLRALRAGNAAFTCQIVGADRTLDSYVVTADVRQESLDAWRHGAVAASATVMFSMLELP